MRESSRERGERELGIRLRHHKQSDTGDDDTAANTQLSRRAERSRTQHSTGRTQERTNATRTHYLTRAHRVHQTTPTRKTHTTARLHRDDTFGFFFLRLRHQRIGLLGVLIDHLHRLGIRLLCGFATPRGWHLRVGLLVRHLFRNRNEFSRALSRVGGAVASASGNTPRSLTFAWAPPQR
jgi:hypothetical protein